MLLKTYVAVRVGQSGNGSLEDEELGQYSKPSLCNVSPTSGRRDIRYLDRGLELCLALYENLCLYGHHLLLHSKAQRHRHGLQLDVSDLDPEEILRTIHRCRDLARSHGVHRGLRSWRFVCICRKLLLATNVTQNKNRVCSMTVCFSARAQALPSVAIATHYPVTLHLSFQIHPRFHRPNLLIFPRNFLFF